MILTESLIQYAIDEAIKSCARFLKETGLKFSSSAKEVELALTTHTNQLNNWSKQISFNDLRKAKRTMDVFVDIDISLMPRRNRIDSYEIIDQINCNELFVGSDNHFVILGQPGAGKTTLMKYLCQSILFNQNFYNNELKIPIIIRLRELNSYSGESSVLINHLFEISGLTLEKVKEENKVKEEDYFTAKKRILYPFLDKLFPLIIFDGFDELSTQKLKNKVSEEFKELVLTLKTGRVILTSRSSDYNYSIDNTSVLEISPLNDQQIKNFATNWLEDVQKSNDFLENLYKSPFVDASIRPLTLSHLCAIYERSGRIPDKPKTIYRKIVSLLLEEWDEQREVRRLTEYGNFEIDRKFEFLSRLAFEITINYKKTIFTEFQLKKIYYNIHGDFNLPKSEASKVTKELEGHTGLILQSGYQSFEFAHKSIHEYLCAEHLVRLPTLPKSNEIISQLPNELAIATSISSDSSAYFCELVFTKFGKITKAFKSFMIYSNNFYATYVNRLVIEKPDFNYSQNISYALIMLYTLLRKQESGQLFLFENDLPKQFEEFIKSIYLRNKKFDFTKYYSIFNKHDSEDLEEIIELRLNKRAESYSNLDFPLMPILFAKKSFISGY